MLHSFIHLYTRVGEHESLKVYVKIRCLHVQLYVFIKTYIHARHTDINASTYRRVLIYKFTRKCAYTQTHKYKYRYPLVSTHTCT